MSERQFYDGKYSGYSDEELLEVIDTEYVSKEAHDVINYSSLHKTRETTIYRGKLVHFRQVDKRLDLPPGTAKRLLLVVAKKWGLEVDIEKDNIVRFKAAKWFEEKYL